MRKRGRVIYFIKREKNVGNNIKWDWDREKRVFCGHLGLGWDTETDIERDKERQIYR